MGYGWECEGKRHGSGVGERVREGDRGGGGVGERVREGIPLPVYIIRFLTI